MVLKLNISEKGKAYKLEVENDALAGKSVADVVPGEQIKADLSGYEFKITGGTDFAGFPLFEGAEGIGLKRVLFTKGWGMHDSRKGVRLRKTVRGKTIADSTVQVNLNVVKSGGKKLGDVFGEGEKEGEAEGGEAKVDDKPAEELKKKEAKTEEPKKEEAKTEVKPAEVKVENAEVKEEVKKGE